jgi:hypothetical protein
MARSSEPATAGQVVEAVARSAAARPAASMSGQVVEAAVFPAARCWCRRRGQDAPGHDLGVAVSGGDEAQ